MAASRNGGVTIELTEQSRKNLDLQLQRLNKLSPEAAYNGLIKILFDIKALAQNKLKYDKHIITSRLRNSLYVQTPKKTTVSGNAETYTDNNGKTYNATLDVELTDKEGAVGSNVEYAGAIEYGYSAHTIEAKNFPVLGNKKAGFFGKRVNHPGFKGDSFLYWALKNVDLNKRWREVSAELLGGLK